MIRLLKLMILGMWIILNFRLYLKLLRNCLGMIKVIYFLFISQLSFTFSMALLWVPLASFSYYRAFLWL